MLVLLVLVNESDCILIQFLLKFIPRDLIDNI